MTDTSESLRNKIESAEDLESVVRTMKALAASNINQYENAVLALKDYYHTVAMGLVACFGQKGFSQFKPGKKQEPDMVGVVVFGSDQGLVGQFNDILVNFIIEKMAPLKGTKYIWAVGERVQTRLLDAGFTVKGMFMAPNSINAITPIIASILLTARVSPLYIFHNHSPSGSIIEPVVQRLLPLDEKWKNEVTREQWPTPLPPEVLGDHETTLRALIREYLFVSLFRACAESLASENESRLMAMQRAEKNIDELLEDFKLNYNHLRQSTIDEELFDVIAGFEALMTDKKG